MHQHRNLVIERSITRNHTITDDDVLKSKTLQEVAIDFIKEYKGKERFIHGLKNLRKVTHKQCRVVLKIMIDEARSSFITPREAIQDGRYTVLFGDHEYTLMISEYAIDYGNKYNVPIGTQSAFLLVGPDNSNDFSPIGFIYPNRQFKIRNTLKNNKPLINAVNVLLGADDPIEFGEAYALKSSRCWRCGRDLTKAKSIVRGLGPHCAKILGIADPDMSKYGVKKDKVDPNCDLCLGTGIHPDDDLADELGIDGALDMPCAQCRPNDYDVREAQLRAQKPRVGEEIFSE